MFYTTGRSASAAQKNLPSAACKSYITASGFLPPMPRVPKQRVERLNLAGQAARTAVSAQSALRACMRSLNALTFSGAPRFRRPRSASAPPGTRSLQPLQTLHEPEPSASRRARLGGVPAGVVALGRRRRAAAGPRQRMAAPGRASGEATRSQVRDLGASRVRDRRGQESIPKSG